MSKGIKAVGDCLVSHFKKTSLTSLKRYSI